MARQARPVPCAWRHRAARRRPIGFIDFQIVAATPRAVFVADQTDKAIFKRLFVIDHSVTVGVPDKLRILPLAE